MKPFEYTSKAGKKSMIVELKHMGMFEEVEVIKKYQKAFEKDTPFKDKDGNPQKQYNTQIEMNNIECYITFSQAQYNKWEGLPVGKVKISLNEFEMDDGKGGKRKQKVYGFESLETSNTITSNESVASAPLTRSDNSGMPSFGDSLPVLDERKKAVYDHFKSMNLKPEDMIEWDGKPTMIKDVIGEWCNQ